MGALLFGADGGGTKTLGILADHDGKALARCQVGATNPNVVGIDEAAASLLRLVHECCTTARRTPAEINSMVFGLAGAGSAEIRDRLVDAVNRQWEAAGFAKPSVFVESDARIALEGAFAGGPGMIVIAGTGSIVLGKTAAGELVRVGGWGRALGDEGSGYALGCAAIRAVARDIDGIESADTLRAIVAGKFGWKEREDIIVAVYQENFTIASLAPLVIEAAERGDMVARDILVEASTELAEQVGAMAERLHPEGKAGVVFVGGLITHDNLYTQMVREAIEHVAPGIQVHPAALSPAEGAVLMALHKIQGKH
jgi:N-acetylglucosamine kinase-like BadF-type ATPase